MQCCFVLSPALSRSAVRRCQTQLRLRTSPQSPGQGRFALVPPISSISDPELPASSHSHTLCLLGIALSTLLLSAAPSLSALAQIASDTAAGKSEQAQPSTRNDTDVAAFRRVTALQDVAFEYTNHGDFRRADSVWTELIALNEHNAAAWSNRGNCRTSQGRFTEAIADFDRAIGLSPEEPDPHLGRGVALEGQKQFEEALVEYERANDFSVLRYGAADPVTFYNRGNVYGFGFGDWAMAVSYFHKAASMSRNYVFARANEALALYQLGNEEEGLRSMESLLRKYPEFPDLRAALVAVYWVDSDKQGEAESMWLRVLEQDSRYSEIGWVRDSRRWPPRLVNQLESFLTLKR